MKSNYLSHSNATAWYPCAVLFLVLFVGALEAGCGSSWNGSVGAVLGKGKEDGRVFVREAPSDMGAAKAGVRVGDELIEVEGAPVITMSPGEVHRLLAGRVGTKVSLTVKRGEDSIHLVVERGPLRQ